MKIGCCVNMVATQPDGTGIEFVERLSRFGYDYVELPLAEMMALSEEEFQVLSQSLKQSGIPCETCNNFFPKTVRLTGANVDLPAVLDYTERAFTRAEASGVSIVVFGSGSAKNVPQGFPMEEGCRQVVTLLRCLSPIAQKHHITIVIEPLRKAECNLINTFAEGCRLAEDVGSEYENIRVLVDFYHLSEEKEPVEHLLRQGEEYLRHVHFACSHGRRYPERADEDNYQPFLDALKAIGYDARVSVEAYTQDFDRCAPLALKFLKDSLAKMEG